MWASDAMRGSIWRWAGAVLALVPCGLRGQPAHVPPGWTASQSGPTWTFTLTVEPAESLRGQDAEQWLAARMRAELATRGTVVSSGKIVRQPSGVWLTLAAYRDASGQPWTAVYSLTPRAGGDFQCSYMVFNVPTSEATDYVRVAGTIVGSMASPVVGSTASPVAPAPASAPTSAPVAAGRPGAGVSDDQIDAIFHEGRGTSTASGFAYVESVDLLLRDGWAYTRLTVPPEDLDVEASRRQEPDRWHHWKRVGTDVLMARPDSGSSSTPIGSGRCPAGPHCRCG
jgi:hypothetical protein